MSQREENFLNQLAKFLANRDLVGEDVDPDEIEFNFAPPMRLNEIEDPEWIPTDEADISALRSAPPEYLEAVGMQIFRTFDNGDVLWLFPVHWYDHLPESIEVCTLWRERETFTREEFPMKEARWGALPFGILRTNTDQPNESE